MEEILFRKLSLEDKEQISSYFAKAPGRSCERTFANSYLWSRHYHVKFAIVKDTLVFLSEEGENSAFSYPAGEKGAVKNALDYLLKYSEERNIPFRLYCVTEEDFAQLDAWYPGRFQIQYLRDQADYVYETESLATLAGKKLHGKRNHIHRFQTLYPDWTYEAVNAENVEECFQMALKWRNKNGCEEDIQKNAEICVTLNFLRLFTELGMTGGLLRVQGEVVAFCVGEPLGRDTFVVHVEKAFSEIEGAYPVINQQFVLHECMDYTYINREEDTGAEGLRRAKLSYKPVFLVNKGIVTKKESQIR